MFNFSFDIIQAKTGWKYFQTSSQCVNIPTNMYMCWADDVSFKNIIFISSFPVSKIPVYLLCQVVTIYENIIETLKNNKIIQNAIAFDAAISFNLDRKVRSRIFMRIWQILSWDWVSYTLHAKPKERKKYAAMIKFITDRRLDSFID